MILIEDCWRACTLIALVVCCIIKLGMGMVRSVY